MFSDSVDNSAGVNTSDHEVNIKILLDAVRVDDRLGRDERNELLASMRDEVAQHVLATNYNVARAITNAMAEAHSLLQVHKQQLLWLEEVAHLDRVVEELPSATECDRRWSAGEGLTAPEFGVLMAYTKTVIATDLAGDGLLRKPPSFGFLAAYFPARLRRTIRPLTSPSRLRNELLRDHLEPTRRSRRHLDRLSPMTEPGRAWPHNRAAHESVALFSMAAHGRPRSLAAPSRQPTYSSVSNGAIGERAPLVGPPALSTSTSTRRSPVSTLLSDLQAMGSDLSPCAPARRRARL